MPELASGMDVVDAWKNASKLIIRNQTHRIRNLVVDIERPTTFSRAWLKKFDPKGVGSTDRLSVVVKVLFPYTGKKPNETREHFYGRWNEALKKNKEKKRLRAPWGTYFNRLTAFGGTENQLENIIRALSTWRMRPAAALVAHTSAPTMDTIKPIGSPCLQYVEVLWRPDDVIDLVAVYRNHDFLKKALGNYIGLGRLLEFIAGESGKTPGHVICHSVHAYCDEPNRLRALIAK
jgi:thymidylate synthase